MIVGLSLSSATSLSASSEEDAKTVAALDMKYQAAVKSNDAATMDQILADDFVLVNERGKVSTKADLIESARKKEITYERQDHEGGTQKVRVWGDTAALTALLWIKAMQAGKPILQTLVQRHVYPHSSGLALRFRAGFPAVAEN